MNNIKIIDNTALPLQKTNPFPPGARNIFEAGLITQKNEAQLQQSLVGNPLVGGIKRYKKMRKSREIKGGATPVIVAPSAPSFDTNPELTNNIFGGLSKLAIEAQNNAVFDETTSQLQVDRIAAEQQALFKGGKKRKISNKKGGSWPVWGCLSGGKKTRKHTKNNKCKKRKNKKTRKLVKRHRY